MTFPGMVRALHELVGTARLTPWADNFVETIADRQTRGMKITQKQREIIRELYEKHFRGST